MEVSCEREGILWARVGSRGLLLPQGHPAAASRAAPSRQAWPHGCLPRPLPSSSQPCHETGFTSACYLSNRASGRGALVQSFPQSRVSPFLALIDTGSVSDHKEQVKPMSLEPQGQIYRQKENSLIFFHVFVVTVKIGLLLSTWRHFYCSPFLVCP